MIPNCCKEHEHVPECDILFPDASDNMIIELDVYQKEACKTMKKGLTDQIYNMYYCMKMSEELGELSGMLAKHYVHGKDKDDENLKEELSDLMFYIANMAATNGLTLSEIATFNIAKLRKRHGDSYNQSFYKS